jgi:hypothetical protein
MMDKRLLAAGLLVAVAGGSACGVDTVDPARDPDTGINKELCHTDLSVTGTMVPVPFVPDPENPDLGDTNCWPIGDWTFTAAPKASNEDGSAQCPSVKLLPEYKVRVSRDTSSGDPVDSYSFLTNPSAKTALKVSSGGGGLCEGVFEVYSDDGKILHNLHPALQPAATPGANHVLSGHGEYHEYEVDQWGQ